MMAILLLLCLDDWSTASNSFRTALQASNPDKLEAAIVGVVRDNSPRAVKLLLAGLKTPNEEFYWLIITGLSKIAAKEGIDEIEKTILAKGGDGALKRDLMMSLQLNHAGPIDALLVKIATEGTPDLQLTAIDELVKRGRKEAIPVLIEIVRKEKGTELLRQAQKALVNLTGQDLGTADNWQAWWDKSKETFKVGDAAKAEGGTVAETIKRNRTTDYDELKKGKKEEIIVVSGIFDKVQDVLDKLKIPHSVISKDDFDKQDLSKCMVLLINCDDYMMGKAFTNKQKERIRNFVAQGGYLFTSDWGLVDVLEDAFPGYVKKGGEIPPQMSVEILPKKGSTGHPFLKEVFIKVTTEGGGGKSSTSIEEKIDHKWEIDPVSYTIELDPSKVVVLVESQEIEKSYKLGAVAVTFSFGDGGKERPAVSTGGVYEELPKLKGGKVLHVLSHFGQQKNKNDEFALQNMMLNFLIEAKDRRKMRAAKK